MNILSVVNICGGVLAFLGFVGKIKSYYKKYQKDNDLDDFIYNSLKLAASVGVGVVGSAVLGAVYLGSATSLIGLGALLGVLFACFT
jgi:hypothetical protein